MLKIDGHLSKLEKEYNEFVLQYNKQNVEDILVQRAVKTTIQILYDRALFDNFQNAEEVLKDIYLPQDVDLIYQKVIHNYIHIHTIIFVFIRGYTYNYMSIYIIYLLYL